MKGAFGTPFMAVQAHRRRDDLRFPVVTRMTPESIPGAGRAPISARRGGWRRQPLWIDFYVFSVLSFTAAVCGS